MATYYKLNQVFIAVLRKDADEEGCYKIQVGNPVILAMPCLRILVNPREKTLYLDTQSCNISGNLPHSENGTVYMGKVGLLFALALFPKCKRIHLTDNSGFVDKVSQMSTNLSDRDMFLHKQTWYQRKFPELKFSPFKDDDKALVEKFKSVLQKTPRPKDIKNLSLPLNSETFFSALQTMDRSVAYTTILNIMRLHSLPSLVGLDWIATKRLSTHIFPDVELQYEIMTKPPKLKAQWGGSTHVFKNRHFKRVTWIGKDVDF